MKKLLTAVVLMSFLATGCTGSFNLTKKVYNFHRSQSDKWADELCFLLVAITPIYGFATFADAIVFNSIEFWTGDNPVVLKNGETTMKTVRQGKDKMILAYDHKTDQIMIAPKMDKKSSDMLVLERSNDQVLAKNEAGEVLYSSVKNEQGDVMVYTSSGKLIKTYSAQQINALKEKIARN